MKISVIEELRNNLHIITGILSIILFFISAALTVILIQNQLSDESKIQTCNQKLTESQQAKSELEFKAESACPQILPLYERPLPQPTVKKSFIIIPFPSTENWIEYPSKCIGLSNVKIYYPSSWKFGIEGEQSVRDGYDGTPEGKLMSDRECLIQFGFPVSPGGRQNDYYQDLQAEIWIETYPVQYLVSTKNTIGTVSDLANMEENMIKNYKAPITMMDRKNINGRDYIVSFYGGEGLRLYKTWSTIQSGVVYSFKIMAFTPDSIDPVSLTKVFDIGEELIGKLQFN